MHFILLILLVVGGSFASDSDTYAPLVGEVLYAVNLARDDPTEMGDWLKADIGTRIVGNLICKDQGFDKNRGGEWCEHRVELVESSQGYLNAVNALKLNGQVDRLYWSNALAQAARDHVLDIGPLGKFGHEGSDGSDRFDRVDRYATSYTIISENIVYSSSELGVRGEGLEMVKDMIVDDGVSGKGNRRNILDTDFTQIGVACGCHASRGDVCVVMFGIDVVDRWGTTSDDVRRVSQEQCKASAEWSDNLEGKGTNAVNYYTYWYMKEGNEPPLTPQSAETYNLENPHYMGGIEASNSWDDGESGLHSTQQDEVGTKQFVTSYNKKPGDSYYGQKLLGGGYLDIHGDNTNPVSSYQGTSSKSGNSGSIEGATIDSDQNGNIVVGDHEGISMETDQNPKTHWSSQYTGSTSGQSSQDGSTGGSSTTGGTTDGSTTGSIGANGQVTGTISGDGSYNYNSDEAGAALEQDSSYSTTYQPIQLKEAKYNVLDYLKTTSHEISTGDNSTYEEISKSFFNELKELYDNPFSYVNTIRNEKAKQTALKFKNEELYWNDGLSAVARDYVNLAAPCDLEPENLGFNIVDLFDSYITSFKDSEIVTFKGKDKEDGKELLETMLYNDNFSEAIQRGEYRSIGVACACNPNSGLECMMIFGQDIVHNEDAPHPLWMPKENQKNCMAFCRAN